MNRRRRRPREIPFSFDSFLDIVANVVGVIIRLILVVWVGARSYSAIKEMALPQPAATDSAAESKSISDPLEAELAAQRRDLARLQEELLQQLRSLRFAEGERRQTETTVVEMEAHRQRTALAARALHEDTTRGEQAVHVATLSLGELRARHAKLREEMTRLERDPIPTKALRYRAPVSQPIHAEQLMFELKHGRITFVDIQALLAEVRHGFEDATRRLRTTRQVQAIVGPRGAFRLHYTLERERGALDAVGADPALETNFRYGMSEWRIEPVPGTRGESVEQALAAGSSFRGIVDALDPRQAVLTLWVYPDSFAAYRRLRDYLHDREIVVAGRPLPDGSAIAASPRGSVSRGQ